MTSLDAFLERTIPEPNSGCWLWLGAVDGWGYGRVVIGSRTDGSRRCCLAHRLSWELHFGPIPDGMLVCHTCDVPGCVNPRHLFLGTDRDNHRDKARKGRAAQKLTDNDVRAIRALDGVISHEKIGQMFGITQANASRVIRKATWSHVT